jgi:hypothetical protein
MKEEVERPVERLTIVPEVRIVAKLLTFPQAIPSATEVVVEVESVSECILVKA